MITFSLRAAAESLPDNHTPHKGTPDAMQHRNLHLETVTAMHTMFTNESHSSPMQRGNSLELHFHQVTKTHAIVHGLNSKV